MLASWPFFTLGLHASGHLKPRNRALGKRMHLTGALSVAFYSTSWPLNVIQQRISVKRKFTGFPPGPSQDRKGLTIRTLGRPGPDPCESTR